MLEFRIKPFDVLYFGKTKPFSIGDVVKSDYFPTSYKLVSSICSKLRHAFNIDTTNIIKSFYGPFIEYNKNLYFPKPHNIYKIKSKYYKNENPNKYFILFPINLEEHFEIFKIYDSNNDNSFKSYFLYIGKEDVESFEGFISIQTFEKYVNKLKNFDFFNIKESNYLDNILSLGDSKDSKEILEYKDIFDFEQRIGIKLDRNTRNVLQEDGLYRIDFLTLKENFYLKGNFNYVFYVEFDEEKFQKLNISTDNIINFFNNNRIFKLGGEEKFVYYQLKKQNFDNTLNYHSKLFKNYKSKETIDKILNKDYIFVIFFNIGYYENEEQLKNAINKKFPGFSLVSIIFNELISVGKYIYNENHKKISKKVLPAGTVLFLSKNKNTKNNETKDNQKNISENIKLGIDFLIDKDNLFNSDFLGSNLVVFF